MKRIPLTFRNRWPQGRRRFRLFYIRSIRGYCTPLERNENNFVGNCDLISLQEFLLTYAECFNSKYLPRGGCELATGISPIGMSPLVCIRKVSKCFLRTLRRYCNQRRRKEKERSQSFQNSQLTIIGSISLKLIQREDIKMSQESSSTNTDIYHLSNKMLEKQNTFNELF